MNDVSRPSPRMTAGYLRSLAPSVDPAWTESFVVEQRLLGVSGPDIGDALATVESHVRDSGETAVAAFGDPVAYARDVAGTQARVPDLGLTPSFILAAVCGLVGISLCREPSPPGWRGPWLTSQSVTSGWRSSLPC